MAFRRSGPDDRARDGSRGKQTSGVHEQLHPGVERRIAEGAVRRRNDDCVVAGKFVGRAGGGDEADELRVRSINLNFR